MIVAKKTQCWEKNATAEKTTPLTMEEKIQQYQTKYIPNVVTQMIQITQAPKNHRWTSHFYERAKLKL